MDFPRIGVGLPIVGPHASPDATLTVATAAGRLVLPAAPGWRNVYRLPKFPAYNALEVRASTLKA